MFGVDPDRVSVTVANRPLGIIEESKPQSRHVDLPVLLLQATNLPAAAAAGLAATLIAEMSLGEYSRSHCAAAIWAPEEFMERLSVTTPPTGPEPEERLNATLCAKQAPASIRARRVKRMGLAKTAGLSVK